MFALIAILFTLLSFGQGEDQGRRQQPPGQQPTPTPQVSASPSSSSAQTAPQRSPQERPAQPAEEPPIVTRHEIKAAGRTLRYTATVGMMPIKNRDGETEARILFMAYTLDDAGARGRRFGLNVSSEGTYRKIKSGKPKFDLDN